MPKTRRVRRQNRRRTAHLKGGMQRRITQYFPTVSAASTSNDPEQPIIDTTSNGRPFHLLSESEIASLKEYDHVQYIKWKEHMKELEDWITTLPAVKNVNHTSNGRQFKNLKKNNVAALSEKNASAYSRWRSRQIDERLKALSANLTPEQLGAAYEAIAAEFM